MIAKRFELLGLGEVLWIPFKTKLSLEDELDVGSSRTARMW